MAEFGRIVEDDFSCAPRQTKWMKMTKKLISLSDTHGCESSAAMQALQQHRETCQKGDDISSMHLCCNILFLLQSASASV